MITLFHQTMTYLIDRMQYIFKSMTVLAVILATCIQVVFKYYDMHVHAFKKNAEIINHKVDTLNDKNISSKNVLKITYRTVAMQLHFLKIIICFFMLI